MEELNPMKNPAEYQEKVLDLMKKYELSLKELYAVYAEKFPEQRQFWEGISKEEDKHAYWIETLNNQIGNKPVFFNEERFNIQPLNECLNEASARISEAKNGSLEMIEAISISVVIESGMIEKKFFEVFESDSPEIKKTFNMLRMATLEHSRVVREMWDLLREDRNVAKIGFWQKIKNFFSSAS